MIVLAKTELNITDFIRMQMNMLEKTIIQNDDQIEEIKQEIDNLKAQSVHEAFYKGHTNHMKNLQVMNDVMSKKLIKLGKTLKLLKKA